MLTSAIIHYSALRVNYSSQSIQKDLDQLSWKLDPQHWPGSARHNTWHIRFCRFHRRPDAFTVCRIEDFVVHASTAAGYQDSRASRSA